MNSEFEKFPVYQESIKIAKEIAVFCREINNREFDYLKNQLLRASSSTVLNLAEGSGRRTKRDKGNFYRTSRASALECVSALDLFLAYGLVGTEKTVPLKQKLIKIAGDLQALIFSVEKRQK